MTYHYSVTLHSAREYFLKSILEEEPNITPQQHKEINHIFESFFNYLKHNSEKLFYKNSCVQLLELPDTIILGNEIINLRYNHSTTKRKYLRVTTKRESITLNTPTNQRDKKATDRAKIPNIIHNSDALYARKIILHTPMYIIHDEFLTPALSLCMIIDHINLIYPTYLPNENYKTTPNTQQ